MIEARPQFQEELDFFQSHDFEKPGGFVDAIQDIDAVIHIASVRLSRFVLAYCADTDFT